MWLLFFLSSLVFGLLVFLLNGYCDSHPILTCCLIPLCCIWLQHTNLIKCLQVLQIWLLLSGRIDLFNKWISFLFFNVTSLKLTLWFDFFCSLVHAASLNLTSLKFFFLLLLFSNCLSGFSLSCLSRLFPPLLFFCCVSRTFLHNVFHLFSSVSDLLVHTQRHHNPPKNATLQHILTPSFSQEPTGPTSPAACGSPGHSRFGENTPGLQGRQGWPGGLSLPTL